MEKETICYINIKEGRLVPVANGHASLLLLLYGISITVLT